MIRFARRCTAVALLVLGAAGAAAADPVEDLTALVVESAGSSNPTMAFLKGLARMPDFELGQADIRRALAAANLPPGGALHRLLGPTTRLQKDGDRLAVDRSQATRLAMASGAVKLGRRVRARLRVNGNQAVLDKVDDIDVGESADGLYPLQKVEFGREGGRPVARVTAGYGFLNKSVTVDLSPIAAAAASVSAGSRRPTSRGINGALND